jgi:hypothetical protein
MREGFNCCWWKGAASEGVAGMAEGVEWSGLSGGEWRGGWVGGGRAKGSAPAAASSGLLSGSRWKRRRKSEMVSWAAAKLPVSAPLANAAFSF